MVYVWQPEHQHKPRQFTRIKSPRRKMQDMSELSLLGPLQWVDLDISTSLRRCTMILALLDQAIVKKPCHITRSHRFFLWQKGLHSAE